VIVQFQMRFRDAIADGRLDLTFRRWRARQVVAGHTYRTAAGRLEVVSVDVVDPASITRREARRAGHPDVASLLADLRGDPALPLYRVAFRPAGGPDPRSELADSDALSAEEVAEIDRRLDRLDRASRSGPWTVVTLGTIAASPGIRAADLAAGLGRETAPFKLDVRKLKALGLTHSLEVGYRLSPRGESYRRLTLRTAAS
jgi:hypothetical protein